MPKVASTLGQILITCGLLLVANRASGATVPEKKYCVDVWGTAQGLPQNSVISMIQTQDGYLWFGTLNGLVRFDGIRFSVFDESNTPGLKSSRIVKVFEDSKQNIWLGTETAGAALIKDGRVISLEIGLRQPASSMGICEDASGDVWLHTADGELGRYKNESMDVWNIDSRFSRCRAVIAEKSDLVWVGSDHSLFAINPAEVVSSNSLPQEQKFSVGKFDFLLASKAGGHWRMVDGSVQNDGKATSEKSWSYPWRNETTVTSAGEDREGNLIVGTLGEGLFWFDAEGNVNRISQSEGLSDNSVLSLHADKEGSLWVGLDGGGLNRVTRQLFEPLEKSLGLTVQSAAEDDQGGLWFSSNSGGIDYWKNGEVKNFPSIFGSVNINTRAILVDRQQRVWAGAQLAFGAGLFQLQNGVFQPTRRRRD